MALEIYLNFNGTTRQAVTFYAEVFETSLEKILTFGEGPSNPAYPMSEETKQRVMYTFLTINGNKVHFSDTFDTEPVVMGNNMSIMFGLTDVEAMKAIFNRLKVGGNVHQELQETFFSKAYGVIVDQFGITWQFNHIGEEA